MFRPFFLILLIATLIRAKEPSTKPTTYPAQPLTDRRVLIFSIDGCRPDLILQADMPTLHAIIPQSTYTLWAQSTVVSVTIPSHVSMLTGARPPVHEMEWNHDLPLSQPVYPKVPTLFQVARGGGYTTGMIAGKGKFDCLEKPGTLTAQWLPVGETTVPDRMVLSHALQIIADGPPQVLFVHLPQNDVIGHAQGWCSPRQIEHLREVDDSIRYILLALRDADVLDKTLILITADHGGAGRSHGPEDSRSRCIPWIAIGPGVRHGVDLSCVAGDRIIHIEDTFSTAADFLKLKYDDRKLFGESVDDIWNRPGEVLYINGKTPQDALPVDWNAILGPAPWRLTLTAFAAHR